MDTDSVAEPVKDSKTAAKPASRRPSGVLPEVEVLAQLVVIIFLIDQKLLEEVRDPASSDNHLKCISMVRVFHAPILLCSSEFTRLYTAMKLPCLRQCFCTPRPFPLSCLTLPAPFFLWLIVRKDSFIHSLDDSLDTQSTSEPFLTI